MKIQNYTLLARKAQVRATKSNRQRDFFISLEQQLEVKKPLWIDRNLIEWRRIEEDIGIKVWQIREDKLVSATQIRSSNIIGRYKITPKNTEKNFWEFWFDIESNHNLTTQTEIQQNFTKLKKATLKVIKALSWFGIPLECIIVKSSGRGFHVHVFILGVRDEAQYRAAMNAIIIRTALPNVKGKDYSLLDSIVFGIDRASLKTVTKIREFGAVNDKLQGVFHYCSSIPIDKFPKLRNYPFTFNPDKVVYPEIKIFKVNSQFIRKLHEVNTKIVTAPLKATTEKAVYDLDGDLKELYNCPLIKALAEKSKEKRHLTNIERVFLSQTFCFFGEEGNKELHNIMSNCSDYDDRYTQYQINSMKRNNRKPVTCEWTRKNVGCPSDCKGSTGKSPIKFAWKTIGLKELKNIFRKWLCFTTADGTEVLDVLLATACDQKKAGDAIWMFLVAPSGGIKTELIRSLKDWETYGLDTLTAQTLISGMVKYVDGVPVPAAGIMEELDNKILVIKDFTLVLTKNVDTRNAIFGMLRNAYDGYLEAAYGTLKEKIVKKAHFGVIAGVTPIIDNYHTLLVLLGERFLKIRHTIDRAKAVKKALENQGKEKQMRKELRQAVYKFLKNINFDTEVAIPKKHEKRLVDLAMFIAKVRTPVWTQRAGAYQDFEFMATTEYATRLVKQLVKLTVLLAIIRGETEATQKEIATVTRVGFNTLPQDRLAIIMYLYKNGASYPTPIAQHIGLDNKTVTRKLHQMTAIGEIVEVAEADYEQGKWQLHDSTTSFLDGSMKGEKRYYSSLLSLIKKKEQTEKKQRVPPLSNPSMPEPNEEWIKTAKGVNSDE